MGTIKRSFIEIDKAKLSERFVNKTYLNKILLKFTLVYKPHVGNISSMKLYKQAKTNDGLVKILFPKADAELLYKLKLVDGYTRDPLMVMPPPISRLKNAPFCELFPNQQFTVNHLMTTVFSEEKISKNIPGCNLIMVTGAGKSRVALAIAHIIGRKTLVIAPNQIVLKGWRYDEFPSAFMLAESGIGSGLYNRESMKPTIGVYTGKEKIDGDIIVGIIHTIVKQPYEWFNQFGLVILDESPDYCTPTFSEFFWKGLGICTLSLTATPTERIDGFDIALRHHVGPIVDISSIPGFTDDGVKFTGSVEVIKYNAHPDYSKHLVNPTTGILSTSMMIMKQFIKDPYRLTMIANKIKELYDAGRHIYVFSEPTEYCRMLKKALIALGLGVIKEEGNGNVEARDIDVTDDDVVNDDDGSGAHIIMGGATNEQITNAKMSSPKCVILVTYSYLRRGVSFPQMDTIVLTTPRRSGMTQIIGRIIRRNGNPDVERLIVDVIDNSTALKNQFTDRKKAYIAKGYPINNTIINWNDINVNSELIKQESEEELKIED